jgi:hypothetical protein
MELSVILFFILLMIPGCWLILSIRQEINERKWLNEQQRIEQERMAAMSVRHRSARRSAWGHAGAPGVGVSPATVSTEPPLAHQDASKGWSGAQADSWQDLTDSHVGAAFESFLRLSPRSSEGFTTSQIDEAFEKFLGDLSVVSSPSQAVRSGRLNI